MSISGNCLNPIALSLPSNNEHSLPGDCNKNLDIEFSFNHWKSERSDFAGDGVLFEEIPTLPNSRLSSSPSGTPDNAHNSTDASSDLSLSRPSNDEALAIAERNPSDCSWVGNSSNASSVCIGATSSSWDSEVIDAMALLGGVSRRSSDSDVDDDVRGGVVGRGSTAVVAMEMEGKELVVDAGGDVSDSGWGLTTDGDCPASVAIITEGLLCTPGWLIADVTEFTTVPVESPHRVVRGTGGFSTVIIFAACIARCTTDSLYVVAVVVDTVVFGAIALTFTVCGRLEALLAAMVKWLCPGSSFTLLAVVVLVLARRDCRQEEHGWSIWTELGLCGANPLFCSLRWLFHRETDPSPSLCSSR